MENDIQEIRDLINILKDMMPEDCAEILQEKFNIILKEIKEKGLNEVIKEWYNESDVDVILE
ncbi:hypothetical protein DFR86_10100 [Acidianus sulfidivorans JP7]|uniref:Uncharacterized protein n=1 Tax=Acidianus sulfidivorans JP7 TaxID=619593 RepID=A0A2U9IPC1_9CREN|nr:hypothetical protein [Acidianus sulfidivorans]AWR97855.1 hypothetical protein DFR86_10100 [Acidianus sulfidivorans JP7]